MRKPKLYICQFIFLLLFSLAAKVTAIDSLASPKLWLAEQNRIGQELLAHGSEFSQTIRIFKKAYDFAQEHNLSSQFTEIAIGYGIALYKSGDFKGSYATLLEVLPKLDESKLKQKAEVNQILGMNLFFRNKYSEAYKYQVEALKYYTDEADSLGMMNVYYDLGTNFGGQETFDLSLEYHQKGIEIAKALGDPKMIILGTTAIGGVWAATGDYEKALSFSSESIKLAKSLKDDEELAWASLNRGHILGLIEKYKEAEFYLNQAYDLSFVIKNQLLTGYCLEQLSDIYMMQDNLPEAIKKLDESYELYKESGQTKSERSVVKKYAEIYFKMGDFGKYKAYTDKYIAIKDSIYSKEMMESMANLKQDYEIHKIGRENHIALLKKDQEIKNAKNYFAIALFCGAAGILMLLLTLMYNRNKASTEKNDLLTAKNAEILRQNEFLANSNQDLEKFAYIISHDLKEPLRNINGFTKLLSRKLRNYADDDVQEYSQFIVNGTAQMGELLSGLLEYSKVNTNKSQLENIDVNDLVNVVANSMKIQMMEKNCELELGELPEIFFRKTQLTQIFQNLIANAIKFSSNKNNKVIISVTDQGDEYCFCVKDSGIGIAQEYQKDIFIVFQRLHDRGTYSGSGIGLATCKKIVEDRGGKIWVESAEGKGSCFYFTVPKNKIKSSIHDISVEKIAAPEMVL